MATTRGLERLVFFTDAIAAIAITLLILPLVDLVPQVAAHGGTLGSFLDEQTGPLAAFAISFAVIARLWYGHHQVFEHVGAYTPRLVLLTVLWAFTIVLFPLPTSITSQFDPSPGTVAFYIGTMAASSIVLTSMTLLIRGDSRLESADNPMPDRMVARSLSISTTFLLALLVGTAVPVVNNWALFLLFLSRPIAAILNRRLRRR